MARVAGPYGVRGWCRIQPLSEANDALLEHSRWWLRGGKTETDWQERVVEGSRIHGKSVVAKFSGIETPEAALALRGAEVGLPQSALPRAADEFFWSELVGFNVVNRAGVMLGQVVELIDNGAHPILRVRSEGEQAKSERLIPWVAAYIDGMDALARRIEVDWAPDY